MNVRGNNCSTNIKCLEITNLTKLRKFDQIDMKKIKIKLDKIF